MEMEEWRHTWAVCYSHDDGNDDGGDVSAVATDILKFTESRYKGRLTYQFILLMLHQSSLLLMSQISLLKIPRSSLR